MLLPLFLQNPHYCFFKCCFTETARTIRDGEPWMAASTFTQLQSSDTTLSRTACFNQDCSCYEAGLWMGRAGQGRASHSYVIPSYPLSLCNHFIF